MAAGLHRDFVHMALDNALATPGEMRVLGTPVDLGTVERRQLHRRRLQRPHRRLAQRVPVDAAARRREPVRAVHERPHPGADQPARRRTSRSSYRLAGDEPADLADWEEQAVTHRGSWWPDYIAWLEPRAGELVPAPKKLGSRAHKAMAKAPGTYVMAS